MRALLCVGLLATLEVASGFMPIAGLLSARPRLRATTSTSVAPRMSSDDLTPGELAKERLLQKIERTQLSSEVSTTLPCHHSLVQPPPSEMRNESFQVFPAVWI